MKICRSCNNQIEDDSIFCPYCGKNIDHLELNFIFWEIYKAKCDFVSFTCDLQTSFIDLTSSAQGKIIAYLQDCLNNESFDTFDIANTDISEEQLKNSEKIYKYFINTVIEKFREIKTLIKKLISICSSDSNATDYLNNIQKILLDVPVVSSDLEINNFEYLLELHDRVMDYVNDINEAFDKIMDIITNRMEYIEKNS